VYYLYSKKVLIKKIKKIGGQKKNEEKKIGGALR